MKRIWFVILTLGCLIGVMTRSHADDISFEQMKKILTDNEWSNVEELNLFEKEWRENAVFPMSKTEFGKLMQFCYERLVGNDYGKVLAKSSKQIETLTPEEIRQLNKIVYTQEILSRGYVLRDEYALKYHAFIIGKNGILKDAWLNMIASAKADSARAEARKRLLEPYEVQKQYLKNIISNQTYQTDLSAYYYLNFLHADPVCEKIKNDSALVENLLPLIDGQFAGSIFSDSDHTSPDVALMQLYIALAPLESGIQWLEKILKLPDLSPQVQALMKMRLNQLKVKLGKEE